MMDLYTVTHTVTVQAENADEAIERAEYASGGHVEAELTERLLDRAAPCQNFSHAGKHVDGYTSTPTHLRIYREDCGDEFLWSLDGADDKGRYTEDVRRFETHALAVAGIRWLIEDTESDGVVWDWQWRGRKPSRVLHSNNPKATYHGIVKAECLSCGYTSTDVTEMELWNDYGVHCMRCTTSQSSRWTNEDGTSTIIRDQ